MPTGQSPMRKRTGESGGRYTTSDPAPPGPGPMLYRLAYPPPLSFRDGMIGAVFCFTQWRTAEMADEQVPPADVVETTTDATATQTATIDPAEYARMQKALKDANKEAADRRKKLEAYEQAEAAKLEADKSETQKAIDAKTRAEQDAASARAELQEERTKNAALAAAGKSEFGDGTTKQKFIDPDAAYVYIKATNPAITADEIPDALKSLAKSKSWMLEGASTQQHQNNPGPSGGQRPKGTQTPATTYPRANF